MYNVLITDHFADEGLKLLAEDPQISVAYHPGLTGNALWEALQEADGWIIRSQTRVTAEALEHATRLRAIARAGVGVDNVDLSAATQRGILVFNAPEGNTISAAEHTLAMMLSLIRHIPQADCSLRSGRWERNAFVGVELRGKTLGLIGAGRVGSEVARRAQGFEMTVVAYDPFLTDTRASQMGIRKADLRAVLQEADFLSVHTPLTPETKGMIGAAELRTVKPTVRIINCARGGIIDEAALAQALQEERVAGAAIDVWEEEPPFSSPLYQAPHTVITPHLGASTYEAQVNVAIDAVKELLHALHGQPFRNAVNLPPIPAERFTQLQPYLELANILGKLMGQRCQEINEVIVTYAGLFSSERSSNNDAAWCTRQFLAALFARYMGERVNLVNALALAERYGIKVAEEYDRTTEPGEPFRMRVLVKHHVKEQASVAATRLGNAIHLVEVDGYPLDLVPEANMLLFSHTDQPGIIGRIGSRLGEAGVNIASMQVGRRSPGGQAIGILTMDAPIDTPLLEELATVPGIVRVTQITL